MATTRLGLAAIPRAAYSSFVGKTVVVTIGRTLMSVKVVERIMSVPTVDRIKSVPEVERIMSVPEVQGKQQ